MCRQNANPYLLVCLVVHCYNIFHSLLSAGKGCGDVFLLCKKKNNNISSNPYLLNYIFLILTVIFKGISPNNYITLIAHILPPPPH